MTFTITSTTTAVILRDERIDFGTTREIANFIFGDGTDIQTDMGKNSDYITVSGSEATYCYSKMYELNRIMNLMEDVTLSGMADSTLNTDFLISDLNYTHEGGQLNRYNWSNTLERKQDRLG